MTDTAPEAPVTPEAPVEQIEKKEEAVQQEIEKLEEKLDDPGLTDSDRVVINKRLDVLDDRLEELLQKLDKLASSPVAPAPQRKVADLSESPEATTAETPKNEGKPKERKHRYGSSKWFGERAYEDD